MDNAYLTLITKEEEQLLSDSTSGEDGRAANRLFLKRQKLELLPKRYLIRTKMPKQTRKSSSSFFRVNFKFSMPSR